MLTLLLTIVAIIFGILSVAGVPTRVSWSGLGVICLGTAMLVARGGLT